MGRLAGVLRRAAAPLAVVLALAGCAFSDEPEEPHTPAFCDDYRTLEANFASLPTGSLEELREGLDQLATDAEVLATRTPSAVEDDMDAVAAGLREAADAAAGADSLEAARDAATGVVDEAAYQSASDRVAGWTDDSCGQG